MKKLFFLFVLCLIGGAWFYRMAASTPGYLLISVGNTSVEFNLWFLLIVLFVLALTGWLAYGILRGSVKTVGRQVVRLVAGSDARAQQQMAKGFIHYFEGNWRQSLQLLNKSAARSPAPLVNYLGAAHSAYEMGDAQQAGELLRKAEQQAPEAELAILLSQAQMQFAAKKYEQCAASLERARKVAPRNAVVLDMLKQVYLQLQDWAGLETILPMLKQQPRVTEDELNQLSKQVYIHLLDYAEQTRTDGSVQQVWKRIPKSWQRDPDIALAYVTALADSGDIATAEQAIRRNLPKDWHSGMVLLYGRLATENPQQQLQTAEAWLKDHPDDAPLLLTAGRLALRNQLWDKARDYFESSLNAKALPETYAETARLAASLGEHDKSMIYYQKGLQLTASDLPELPLPS